ncbi:MAG: Ig-like domain-containing protein, partial [Candidatus Korarchaeota archaeon]
MKHQYKFVLLILVIATGIVVPLCTLDKINTNHYTSRSSYLAEVESVVWNYPGYETHISDTVVFDIDGDGFLELVAVGFVKSSLNPTPSKLIAIWQIDSQYHLSLEYNATFENLTFTSVDVDRNNGRLFIAGYTSVTWPFIGNVPVLDAVYWDGLNLNRESVYIYQQNWYSKRVAVNSSDGTILLTIQGPGSHIQLYHYSYTPGTGFGFKESIEWGENVMGNDLFPIFANGLELNNSQVYVAGWGRSGTSFFNFVRKINYDGSGFSLAERHALYTDSGNITDCAVFSNGVYAVGAEGSTTRKGKIWFYDPTVSLRRIADSLDNVQLSATLYRDVDLDTLNEMAIAGYNSTHGVIELWGEDVESRALWSFDPVSIGNVTDVEATNGFIFVSGDLSNNSIFIKVFDSRDPTPPLVSIVSPTANANVSGVVRIEASVTDADSPIQKVEFLINGTSIANLTASPYITEWDTRIYLPGPYNITVKAWDVLNNTNSASIVVNVMDILPPDINILSPTEGSVLENETYISANISDGSKIANAQVFIDGTIIYTNNSIGTQSYLLNITFNPQLYANGTHIITVVATDEHGLQKSSSVTVNIRDVTEPYCEFANLQNGTIVGGKLTIIIIRSDASGIQNEYLYVNGTTINVANGIAVWDTTLFDEGTYNVTYVVTDGTGLSNSCTAFVVLKDMMAPTIIEMFSKTEGDYTTLTLLVHDRAGIKYVDVVIGPFVKRLELIQQFGNGTAIFRAVLDYPSLQDGTYSVTIVTEDSYGNIGRHEMEILYQVSTTARVMYFIQENIVAIIILVASLIGTTVAIVRAKRKAEFKSAIAGLRAFIIHHTSADVPIFTVKFKVLPQEELLTSFISALKSFSSELGGGGIRTMSWENLTITSIQGKYVSGIALSSDPLPPHVEKILQELVVTFETKYGNLLAQFDGRTSPYSDFSKDVERVFGRCSYEDIVKTISERFATVQRAIKETEEKYKAGQMEKSEYTRIMKKYADEV